MLVGEATRRATEAAIAYEAAGEHELKGKAEPVALYRALRVTAARGGAQKSGGPRAAVRRPRPRAAAGQGALPRHAPRSGKAQPRLGHRHRRHRQVAARLGVREVHRRPRRRRLVAPRPLPRLRRRRRVLGARRDGAHARAGSSRTRHPTTALAKLRATIEEHVPDADERAWSSRGSRTCSASTSATAPDREDLFAAWRLFFERLAEQRPGRARLRGPPVGRPGLLDFVEYLLEWSRSHPIFVLALARPELLERRPDFGARGRNATHALARAALRGGDGAAARRASCPGLPDELRAQILDRAEGVPLYAVETVRMLLDRGLLAREGDVYRPTGPIEALDVPRRCTRSSPRASTGSSPTSGAAPGRLRARQDVHRGRPRGARRADRGRARAACSPRSSARRCSRIQADPRSPERGQYGFLQDLLKRVAYETLAKPSARRATSRPPRISRRRSGRRAGDRRGDRRPLPRRLPGGARRRRRARDQGAGPGDAHPCGRARRLPGGERRGAALLRAGRGAQPTTRSPRRSCASGPARRRGHPAGSTRRTLTSSARSSCTRRGIDASGRPGLGRLGEVEWRAGQLEEALEPDGATPSRCCRTTSPTKTSPPSPPSSAASTSSRASGARAARIDTAIEIAESLWLPEVSREALNTQGLIAGYSGRSEQALALIKHALELALENDLTAAALRAYNNLGDLLDRRDRYEEAIETHRPALALARKAGNRMNEWRLLGELGYYLMRTGEWAEALELSARYRRTRLT